MPDAEMTTDPVYPRYWLAEAVRSWDEGDPGLALRFAKVAVLELEDEQPKID